MPDYRAVTLFCFSIKHQENANKRILKREQNILLVYRKLTQKCCIYTHNTYPHPPSLPSENPEDFEITPLSMKAESALK